MVGGIPTPLKNHGLRQSVGSILTPGSQDPKKVQAVLVPGSLTVRSHLSREVKLASEHSDIATQVAGPRNAGWGKWAKDDIPQNLKL